MQVTLNEKAHPERLHPVWFHLYNTLELIKLGRNSSGLPLLKDEVKGTEEKWVWLKGQHEGSLWEWNSCFVPLLWRWIHGYIHMIKLHKVYTCTDIYTHKIHIWETWEPEYNRWTVSTWIILLNSCTMILQDVATGENHEGYTGAL